MSEHTHDYLVIDENRRYRDEEGKEFVVDTYICRCGAGGNVKTPKELLDKDIKIYGITEDKVL